MTGATVKLTEETTNRNKAQWELKLEPSVTAACLHSYNGNVKGG